MRANLNSALVGEDLCAEAEVSERTLRYAFGDIYGQGPMAFFKILKLHAVRGRLMTGGTEVATVHEIARRWGFTPTGNFAADYRRLFGELPSEACPARPVSVGCSLSDQKS